MKEMILLFNPPAKEQLLKIRSALLPLHIRIQLIKPEQYNQPLGYLAGMKDISPVEGNYAGEELPDTMFLFSSLSSSRLGCIADVEINICTGEIEAIVIPGPGKICGFFGTDCEYVIPFSCIKKIGPDIVLVEIKEEKFLQKF